VGLFRNLALAIPQIRRLNESRNTIIRERDDVAARLAESERRLAAEVELRALTYAAEEIVRAAFRSMLGREIS
jgi:hypothetical protein